MISPAGIAVAPDGRIYVADDGDHRVKIYGPGGANGTFESAFSLIGAGPGDIVTPYSIAVGPGGRVAVADGTDHSVSVFDGGAFAFKIGGRNGSGALPGGGSDGADGRGALPGQFYGPSGMAFGGDGRLYVADTGNHRVQAFLPSGAFAFEIGCGASGLGGGGSGGGGCGRGHADGQLASPSDVAVSPDDRLYVADTGNYRIQVFSADGDLQSAMGSRGSLGGYFERPAGLSVDGSGRLYVADPGNGRLHVFESGGAFSHSFASRSGEVVAASDGRIYLHDGNGGVGAFQANGSLLFRLPSYGGAPGEIVSPSAVAVLPDGTVLASGAASPRLYAYHPNGTLKPDAAFGVRVGGALAATPDGTVVTAVSGGLVALSLNGSRVFSAPASGLGHARAVAVGPDGTIAASYSSRVYVFHHDGTPAFSFAGGGHGIAIDPLGRIATVPYSPEGNVNIYTRNGAFVTSFGTTARSTPGHMSQPLGIAVAPDGRIYVADTGNDRVQVFRPDGSYEFTIGSTGIEPGQFDGPTAIGVVNSTMIVVADGGNSRLQAFRIDPAGIFVAASGARPPPTHLHGASPSHSCASVEQCEARHPLTLLRGSTLDIRASFPVPVTVTGTPLLALETGAADRTAAYAGGSGGYSLDFRYTVREGDEAARLSYAEDGALAASNGSMTDAGGRAVALALPAPGARGSLSANTNITVDGVPPRVESVSADYRHAAGPGAPAALLAVGDEVVLNVTFTENVAVSSDPRRLPSIAMGVGGELGAAHLMGHQRGWHGDRTYHDSGSNTLRFLYVVAAGDSASRLDYANSSALVDTHGLIADAVGNSAVLALPAPGEEGSLSYSANITVDGIYPSIASVSSPTPNATVRLGHQVAIDVRFTENVTLVDRGRYYDCGGSPPYLLLDNNGYANYRHGNETDTLSFVYTPWGGYTDSLQYYGRALRDGHCSIVDDARNAANLTLPEQGGPGSLSANTNITVDARSTVARLYALVDGPDDPELAAIRLAVGDVNTGTAAGRLWINLTVVDVSNGSVDAPALASFDRYKDRMVGPSSDAALYHAADLYRYNHHVNNIISPGSSAPALHAIGAIRLSPPDTNQALVLARIMDDAGITAVVPVVQNDLYGSHLAARQGQGGGGGGGGGGVGDLGQASGFVHGILPTMAGTLAEHGIVMADGMRFSPISVDWAAGAAVIDEAIANLTDEGHPAGRVGVAFLGSPEQFVALAPHAGGLRSKPAGWFGIDGLSASPALASDADALAFAKQARLLSTKFDVAPNEITRRI